ncbi:SRPBCC family protein [Methanomassiliicoccus luminyensis]|jgi:hypothetical protein|uniref:hypothetical protein n=1 Tax=Methanomassiliicoccus luminyensis TaxID=1080712 RepID=UPI0003800030|nr:hypothetical protein [Methanomassiliicoccus luminyensis]
MAPSTVEKVIIQRLEMLSRSNPELEAEWAIINDDWGIISLSQGPVPIGFEYVESEASWVRPERIKVYEETMLMGLSVVVMVPEEAYLDVKRAVQHIGPKPPAVLSYDSIGITPVPRPS